MTAPTPLERLEQALAELGALTPDGIADRMQALGIKGERHKLCRCVLAAYLESLGLTTAAVMPRLETGPTGPWYASVESGTSDGRIRVRMPESLAEFARRFDRGVYLDLVVVGGGAADA